MKKLLYLTSFFFVYGCGQTEPGQQPVQQRQDRAKESKFKTLIAKYKDISFDTLKLFSSDDPQNNAYRFKGTKLDSTDILLFPESVAEQYQNNDGCFACFRFSIDSNKIGLITRTPSTYDATSIRLMILDKKTDKITGFIELAETFGDAGDRAEKISWLYKDGNSRYKLFTWVEESHDHSVEDEKDTTIERWNNYYLTDLSKSKVDTISTDEKLLTKRFENLLKK